MLVLGAFGKELSARGCIGSSSGAEIKPGYVKMILQEDKATFKVRLMIEILHDFTNQNTPKPQELW